MEAGLCVAMAVAVAVVREGNRWYEWFCDEGGGLWVVRFTE